MQLLYRKQTANIKLLALKNEKWLKSGLRENLENGVLIGFNQPSCFFVLFFKRLSCCRPPCQLTFWRSQRSSCVNQSESWLRRRSSPLRESASSTSMWRKRWKSIFQLIWSLVCKLDKCYTEDSRLELSLYTGCIVVNNGKVINKYSVASLFGAPS